MAPLPFTAALAKAAAMAHSTLDVALHERLAAAIDLVRDGHCFQLSDGTWTVHSATDPQQTYTHVNGACPCDDVHYNRPPQGLCKHRISVYLARRVFQLMTPPPDGIDSTEGAQDLVAQSPGVETVTAPAPDGVASSDTAPDALGSTESAPAPDAVKILESTPLPEAPVSITLKATLHGHEVLVTLRGHDFASVQAQVEQASQWLRAQAPATPAPQGQRKDWCQVHQTRMKQTTKDGRSWWSHKTADGWCKGK